MFKLLFLFLLPLQALSQWDLSVGSQLRSYPSLGGEVFAQTGYNYVFWGEGDKKNPLYGLIRPAVEVSTSAVINSVNGRIEFYPVSFIGIAKGRQHIRSDYSDFTFFDCEEHRCKGDINREYTEYKMALAFKGITAMGIVRLAHNTYSNNNGEPVAEFRTVTLVGPDRDSKYYSQYVLGYQFRAGLLALATEYTKFEDSDQYYKGNLLLFGPKFNKTSMIFGAGTFESSQKAKGFIVVYRINYDILPTKKLF